MIFWAQGKTTNKKSKSKVIRLLRWHWKVSQRPTSANLKGLRLVRAGRTHPEGNVPSCFPLRHQLPWKQPSRRSKLSRCFPKLLPSLLCELVMCKTKFAEFLGKSRPLLIQIAFVYNFTAYQHIYELLRSYKLRRPQLPFQLFIATARIPFASLLHFVCSHLKKQSVQRHQASGVEPCGLNSCG